MRKVFAVMEGEQLPDGRTLDVGALYIAEDELDRVPVCWANDNQNPHPEGWAHGFQRINHDNHGDLSMDIVMNDDVTGDMLDQVEVYPYCTELEEDLVDNTQVPHLRQVHKARLRMLQLVPIPGIAFGMTKHRG